MIITTKKDPPVQNTSEDDQSSLNRTRESTPTLRVPETPKNEETELE